ncbi:hypothetical protein SAMN05421538_104196 [Paracoccus isoporae]|uniref:Uncharacterized protein n=1 Tax=Paracoccus isoporae TaxID=591205 RepID=A0A1G7AQ90_9RHOB|nr:hypothetical protein SAMN05421538_104196 [Paracoccus isoporae]
MLIYVAETTASSATLQSTIRTAQQSSGGRLYVISSDGGAAPQGAQILHGPEDLAAIRDMLSQSDSLFASAWFSRRQDKARAGDGESWDTGDFDCP